MNIEKKTIRDFFYAIEGSDNDKLKDLIFQFPKLVNAWGTEKQFEGINALQFSIMVRNYPCSKLLIENGANVNTKTRVGAKQTPLHLMLGPHIDSDLVKLLLKSGAKPNTPNRFNELPLSTAAELACTTYTIILDRKNEKRGFQTLSERLEKLQKVISLLVAHGADPSKSSKNGVRSTSEYLQEMIEVEDVKIPEWLMEMVK